MITAHHAGECTARRHRESFRAVFSPSKCRRGRPSAINATAMGQPESSPPGHRESFRAVSGPSKCRRGRPSTIAWTGRDLQPHNRQGGQVRVPGRGYRLGMKGIFVDYDVVVIGGTGIDTIVRVESLEIPAGDYVEVPPIHDYVAHSGNGVALGFHALGLRTKFIDFLGDDSLGGQILDKYAQAGLDFSHLITPAGTPRSVNLVDREGRRFSFYDGRYPAGLRLPREFMLPFLERTRHVHVSNGSTTRDVFDDTERLGLSTSTDVHSWDGREPSALGYACRSDVVFLSAANIQGRCDEVMRDILAQGRARLVVATDGPAGCRVLSRDDHLVRIFPAARPERPVVDSNGAGDAFSTAFLFSWLAGRDLEECVLAGSVSGAFACGSLGTHEEFLGAAGLMAACARAKDAWDDARRACR
jgi:sugar/nucleoside kinase (ribokinase family)